MSATPDLTPKPQRQRWPKPASWRNAYLQGAMELRTGVPKMGARAPVRVDIVRALPIEQVFDYLGIRLDADKADGKKLVINWSFSDRDERWVTTLDNAALTAVSAHTAPDADLSVTLAHRELIDLVLGTASLDAAVAADRIVLAGDQAAMTRLLAMLEMPVIGFPIVEPHPEA